MFTIISNYDIIYTIKIYGAEGGNQEMPKTIVRENDTLDEALKRFKRDVSRSGTLVEARKRQHYMKPSDIRKEKKRALRKAGRR